MARASDDVARRIALVGMMGTGKSSVAARVATTLHWDSVDVDALIEQRRGRSIADIFAAEGEAAFRALEADVVAEVLTPSRVDVHAVRRDAGRDVIVALGGGAVTTPSNRERLGECDAVVWLRAEPTVLARRLADDSSRPLLAGDPLGRLVALSHERDGLYREVATHDLDVSERTLDEVVDAVVAIARDTVRDTEQGTAQV